MRLFIMQASSRSTSTSTRSRPAAVVGLLILLASTTIRTQLAALLVAAIGLYGLIAYSVERRTCEMVSGWRWGPVASTCSGC
jgi:hypothetical protein